jgi:hypothetical protein
VRAVWPAHGAYPAGWAWLAWLAGPVRLGRLAWLAGPLRLGRGAVGVRHRRRERSGRR